MTGANFAASEAAGFGTLSVRPSVGFHGWKPDQILLNSVLDHFRAVVQIELSHHIGLVRIHGFNAQHKASGNFLGGQSIRQEF